MGYLDPAELELLSVERAGELRFRAAILGKRGDNFSLGILVTGISFFISSSSSKSTFIVVLEELSYSQGLLGCFCPIIL